jgi:hypothetical protein
LDVEGAGVQRRGEKGSADAWRTPFRRAMTRLVMWRFVVVCGEEEGSRVRVAVQAVYEDGDGTLLRLDALRSFGRDNRLSVEMERD